MLLSLALTPATFFPDISTVTVEIGFGVGALGGIAIALGKRRTYRAATERIAAELGGLDPDQIEELDDTPLSRAERKQIRDNDRDTWRTPRPRYPSAPGVLTLRTAGMIALRGYLLIAVALVGIKVVQQIAG